MRHDRRSTRKRSSAPLRHRCQRRVSLALAEQFLPLDLDAHATFIDLLISRGVRIAWTQHNLLPHREKEAGRAIYQKWADASDLVFHHSEWGAEQTQQLYRFKPTARHVVHPVPFAGDRPAPKSGSPGTSEVLHLGIFGAPRAERLTDEAIRAFSQTDRNDLRLHVYSGSSNLVDEGDPRIFYRPYRHVAPSEYAQRLLATDALLFPFATTGMLTSGVVGDAIWAGRAAVSSDWGFATETLGDAAIVYGTSPDQLTATLDELTPDACRVAGAEAANRRKLHDPRFVGRVVSDAFAALVTGPRA